MSELQPQTAGYSCCKNVLRKTSGKVLKGCLSSLTASVRFSVAPHSYTATTQGAQKQTQTVFPHGHLQRVQQQMRLEGRGKKEGLWTQWASEIGKRRNLLCSSVKPLRRSPQSAPNSLQEGPCPETRRGTATTWINSYSCSVWHQHDSRMLTAEAGEELCSAILLVSSWGVPGCTAWFI